jgi:protocatechuate 3,4-dioxygenase beta subunit
VLAVLGAFAGAQTHAQAPRNATIAGQVVDATTGKPVSAAVVSISGPGISMRVTPSGSGRPAPTVLPILTGADGRFVFRDLAAGTFTISATKSGYSNAPASRSAGQSVAVTDSQREVSVAVRLWKNAVISGTVLDEAGEAVAGVQVRALGRAMSGGRIRYASSTAVGITDDRGVYRFSNLLPGDYLVVASSPAIGMRISAMEDVARTGRSSGELGVELQRFGPVASQGAIAVGDAIVITGRGAAIPPQPRDRPRSVHIYPPTFHPSTQSPRQASAVSVAPGEERTGIDVQLQPTPTVRVSGSLTSPQGPASMASLRLIPASGDEFAIDGFAAVTGTDAAGAFTFPAVVPGQYLLRSSTRSGTDVHWVDMPISVPETDLDGVATVLRPGLSISGRVEFEGSAPRPERAQIPVRLELADGTPATFPPASPVNTASPAFTLKGYAAGKYLVQVTGSPPGWMFKSAMLNGVDVSETPFDFGADLADLVVAFTDRWTGLGGTVQGVAAAAAIVVVFPVDAQRWVDYGSMPRRLKSARATAQGKFGISSLPPGDYFAIAIPEDQAGDWRDPATLDALARIATRVSIGDGEYRTIDLPLRQVKR